jgi:drug/metabolite transporter (DMT)-like permease
MGAVFAIVTAILFGSNTVAVRIGFRRNVDAELSALMPVLVSVVIAVPVAAVSVAVSWDDDAADLWRFAVAGLIAPGLSQLVFMPAVRYAGASRVGILIGMAPVLSAGLAIALLDESFKAVLAIATMMIVIGGMALAWDPARPVGFRRIGLLYGAAAAFLFSLQAVTLRWASDGRSIPPVVGLAVMVTVGAVIPLSVLLYRKGRAAFADARPALAAFWPAGVLFTLASFGFILAYKYGEVVVVAPLTATESLWTVVLAAILIGARSDAITTRVIGACVLIVVGGILVGISA